MPEEPRFIQSLGIGWPNAGADNGAAGNGLSAARGAPAAADPPADGLPPRLRLVPASQLASKPIFPFDGRDPRAAEQYRIIRTKILHHPHQPRVLMVSSPQSGDGKSVTAANIAGALALKLEANVLLIDADLRRPNLHSFLGTPSSLGLTEVLNEQCDLADAIVRLESIPTLCLLPSGERTRNPVELLDSRPWRDNLARCRSAFQFVIIDAPPVGVVADSELIQAACDGVILVVRPDHTNRTLCLKALEAIPKEKLVGVVMNMNPDSFLTRPPGHHYSYYYDGRNPCEAEAGDHG